MAGVIDHTCPGEIPRRNRENSGKVRPLLRCTRGAVFVEFLIAFLPVHTFFLCVLQLAIIFTVKVVTEHAAVNAARAAAVIIGDEEKTYNGEKKNELEPNGKRFDAIYDAALLTLSPLILNGIVDSLTVTFPPPGTPGGQQPSGTIKYTPMDHSTIGKVRVRVEVSANCRIAVANRIACGGLFDLRTIVGMNPTKTVKAEAIFPYQGASYDYPP